MSIPDIRSGFTSNIKLNVKQTCTSVDDFKIDSHRLIADDLQLLYMYQSSETNRLTEKLVKLILIKLLDTCYNQLGIKCSDINV